MSQRHYEPLSGGRSRVDWGITALMVTVFLLGFFWFVHGNQFPSFYHPEEEIRAKQVISKRLGSPSTAAFGDHNAGIKNRVSHSRRFTNRRSTWQNRFRIVRGWIDRLSRPGGLSDPQLGCSGVTFVFVALSAPVLRSRAYDEREHRTDVRLESYTVGHRVAGAKG